MVANLGCFFTSESRSGRRTSKLATTAQRRLDSTEQRDLRGSHNWQLFVEMGSVTKMSADVESELDMLLSTNDEDFVRLAYRLILGRDPDASGFADYLQQVRSGRDLRQIATEIAHSEEGKRQSSKWRSLLPVGRLSIRSRPVGWLRRRLFGNEIVELRRGIGRLENQLFRVGRSVVGTGITHTANLGHAASADAITHGDSLSSQGKAEDEALPVSAALLGLAGPRPADRRWPQAMRRAIGISASATANDVPAPKGLRVLLDGHISGSYSLAITNRELVQAMVRHGADVDIAVQPRDMEVTDEIKDLPRGVEAYELLTSLVARGKERSFVSSPYIRLYHAWPPATHTRRVNETAIGVFFWEESIIPENIVRLFNDSYDGIIVTTWFIKKTLIDNGCRIPIELVPFPHELLGNNLPQQPARRGDRRYIDFLHVSSCFARKGPDALLRAFNEVALRIPNLRLIIKSFENPHLRIRQQVEEYVNQQVRNRIQLIIEDLSDQQMADLYRSADAIVLPTRGEGLNMPVIEAAYYGLPVIATTYTGQADFISSSNAWPVAFDFTPSRSHFEREGSLWCEPVHSDLCSRMSEVALGLMNNPTAVWSRSDRLTQVVHKTFLHPRSTVAFELALHRLARTSVAELETLRLRICLVTSWMEVCGIAEYSSFFANALQDAGVAVSVLAPENDRALEGSSVPAIKSQWRQRLYFKLTGDEFDGNVAWFQHHPAFFLLGDDVRHVVEMLRARGILCFITLHSTRELLNDVEQLPSLLACLQQFERVVVHSTHDCNALQLCGVRDNVVVIPHGVTSAATSTRRLLSLSTRNVRIGCFGFLLQHKGVDKLIEMLAIARRESPQQVFTLRLITALRGDDDSRETHRKCLELTRSLGVEEVVEWYTEFLPHDQVMRLLSECDLLILPYQSTSESASGAVRQALASCPNVLVSAQPIFDELRHCAFTVDADDGESIWLSTRKFFTQLGSGEDLERVDARTRWLAAHDWTRIALQSSKLVTACAVDRQYATKWT
jgi:glycosyltransferase involved in cell wall biosynthesis